MTHRRHRAWRTTADRLVALIDDALNRQVNAIIHHPVFQAMEARWRGLALLVRCAAQGSDVKIKVLAASWKELARSMERASEFDQSYLFELVYSREFGMPGGEPFGLLIGDYHLSPHGEAGAPDPVSALSAIATVAAAAFCPFVAGAASRCVGLDSFAELDRVHDLKQSPRDPAVQRWQRLRAREDFRFVGLVAPRVLLRQPYAPLSRFRDDGFPFVETVAADGSSLLWGNAAFAFAAVVIRNFLRSGWFADIRGVTQDEEDGGLVGAREIAPYELHTERHGLSAQPPVEARLTHAQEQQFSEMGIIPVSTAYMSPAAIFNANQSLHTPEPYLDANARQNARLAAMLQYVLCASRFSHYLKVIMRDEVGRLAEPRLIQSKLEHWLSSYTLGNDDAELSLRTRFPLRSAGISVEEMPGRPGVFSCTVRLQPHFQLDDVSTSFHLVAESEPRAAGAPREASPAWRMTA